MRVLVIDDDQHVHEFARLMLERWGHEILPRADNGIQGEMFARDHKPDIILLDINMPVQDGWLTLKNLRASGYAGDVYMLSALPAGDNEMRARRSGADGFIQKQEMYSELKRIVGGKAESGA